MHPRNPYLFSLKKTCTIINIKNNAYAMARAALALRNLIARAEVDIDGDVHASPVGDMFQRTHVDIVIISDRYDALVSFF